jgi:hypothetical protein
MRKRLLFVIVLTVAAAAVVWGVVRYRARQRYLLSAAKTASSSPPTPLGAEAYEAAVERVKADRGALGAGAVEIPNELQHYSDRHWFLAAQVAEIMKYNVHTCQDYVDLAAMIDRGELVGVPSVTNTYVLLGVGAKADDSVFTKYEDDHSIGLSSEGQLDEQRSKLQYEIASLRSQASKLKKREHTKQKELQKQIDTREQELESNEKDKALIDQSYGTEESRQRLQREFESLQTLARNFNGRSFNLDVPDDRQAMKVNMLSSLRPEALKILEEVASSYHGQFDRPLPVSSLVRPEQYQHVLRRVNRNAVTIDTPPHSTGLAFDIDYRYMSAAEQTFLMADLARIKREGRIEVIRERNANYHVFAFVNGTRPSDDLITASLDKATEDVKETNHSQEKPTAVVKKNQRSKRRPARARVRQSPRRNRH